MGVALREGSGKYVALYIYIAIFLSATCFIFCSASLQNFRRLPFGVTGVTAAFSQSFYALLMLGVLSLDTCELHSLQKPFVEASQSSHPPLLSEGVVGAGVSSQLTPALGSAAGLLSGLG